MPGRLRGKTALVTCAADGIGTAIVRRIVAEGARVVANDIASKADSSLARLVSEGYGNVPGHVANHSVESEVASMMERIRSSYGGLDILVNNAFTAFNDTALTELDEQDGAASVASTAKRVSQGRSLTLISSLANLRKRLHSSN